MFSRNRAVLPRNRKSKLLLIIFLGLAFLFSFNLAYSEEYSGLEQSGNLIQVANSDSQPAPLMIVPRPPEDSGLDVRLWTNKRVYRIGENARVNFSLNKSAYVYILDYTPQSGVKLIYPNRWEGNEMRSAGTHTLPSGGYNFGVSGPPGHEYLQALATTKKIDIYQFVRYPNDPFREGGFPTIPDPQRLRDEIQSGLKAKFGLQIGGGEPKVQFQLIPVEWDTDFYDFEVVSTQPANQPPQARFSYSPRNPMSGDRVRFDGSSSYDPDGSIVRWEWDFDGDGRRDAIGRQGYNTYTGTGRVQVRLTVTDNDGATSTATEYIQVGPSNTPPNADFQFDPSNPRVNESIRFDGRSSNDPDGYIVSWNWDFNDDGNIDRTGREVWYSFGYSGSRRVTLTVRDNEGATDTTSRTVRVEPAQPRFAMEEADSFNSNAGRQDEWYWHRNMGSYSRWIWYSVSNRPQQAYLNFELLVSNQNGGSGYGALVEFTIEDRRGNVIERGTVDLANTFRPQYSGNTNGVGYMATGSYRISNPDELPDGFEVRVEWPPRDSRNYFATRRTAVTLAYEY